MPFMETEMRFSTRTTPRKWQRAIYWYGATAIATLVPFLFDLLVTKTSLSSVTLLACCVSGLATAWLISRDMWYLRKERLFTWKENVFTVTVLGAILVLLYLREVRILVWRIEYLEWFLMFFAVPTTCVCWLTERKKAVRVYAGMRGYRFETDRSLHGDLGR